MAKIKRDTLLGLVFFTGMGVLLLASLSLMDSLFYRTESIVVRFPDASGIRNGDPVLVLGMHIGKVESVNYEIDTSFPRHPILLELTLKQSISLHKEPGSNPMNPADRDRVARIEIQDSGR